MEATEDSVKNCSIGSSTEKRGMATSVTAAAVTAGAAGAFWGNLYSARAGTFFLR